MHSALKKLKKGKRGTCSFIMYDLKAKSNVSYSKLFLQRVE